MTAVQQELSDRDVELESERVLEKHAKTFRLAALFLPKEARRDAAIVYAACRRMDDAVDEASSLEAARSELALLRGELSGTELPARELEGVGLEGAELAGVDLPGRAPRDRLFALYADVAARRGFGLTPALDMLAGMESDLGPVRVGSGEELELYCYRVAGTVGLMMSGVLGVRDPRAHHHAVSLGIAMQLTNICRDVLEDAHRDRVYLPATELERRGANPLQLLAAIRASGAPLDVQEAVVGSVRALLSRAEDLYRFAAEGFRFLPFRPRLAVATAAVLYREIGRQLLRRRGGDPLQGRVVVGLARKLWLTMGALVLAVLAGIKSNRAVLAMSPIRVGRGHSSEGCTDRFLRVPLV